MHARAVEEAQAAEVDDQAGRVTIELGEDRRLERTRVGDVDLAGDRDDQYAAVTPHEQARNVRHFALTPSEARPSAPRTLVHTS